MLSDKEWQANVEKCIAYMESIGGCGLNNHYSNVLRRALRTARDLQCNIVIHRSPTECGYNRRMHKENECKCYGIFDYATPDGFVIH